MTITSNRTPTHAAAMRPSRSEQLVTTPRRCVAASVVSTLAKLISAVVASSLSRIALSTRPHGERISIRVGSGTR